MRLQPGCSHVSKAHAPGTVENLVVTSGEVALVVAGTRQLLRRGDAIQFGADSPHTYENAGTAAALVYLVMTYPEPVTY